MSNCYGLKCIINDTDKERMIEDPTGDQLDALLCAVQAAWAWTQRDEGFGVPEGADKLEGWIVDPEMAVL